MLRKNHLKSKIQHRIHEFEILDGDKMTNIGRIYPYSMNLERTKYGHAVAMRSLFMIIYSHFGFLCCCFFIVPKDMKLEIKATLLMATLILVCLFLKS
jgi:hypothetical protein